MKHLLFQQKNVLIMKQSSNQRSDIRIIAYKIGNNMPGAPLFKVQLFVDPSGKRVAGHGHISQATKPRVSIDTNLEGHYSYMCTMKRCDILVHATGYPIMHWPKHAGVGPVILPNVRLTMVLSEDWQSGTANYTYYDSNGNPVEITGVPVKAVDVDVITEDNSAALKDS